MNIRMIVLAFGLGLAASVHADAPGRVWVYQPDGGSYRIGNTQRYDPRSPYSQHRQYQQNLPPRYQGQLPPQYYDRHRGLDRPQRWNGYRPGFDRPQRWQHERRQGAYRFGPGTGHRGNYQAPPRRHFEQRGYRRN